MKIMHFSRIPVGEINLSFPQVVQLISYPVCYVTFPILGNIFKAHNISFLFKKNNKTLHSSFSSLFVASNPNTLKTSGSLI